MPSYITNKIKIKVGNNCLHNNNVIKTAYYLFYLWTVTTCVIQALDNISVGKVISNYKMNTHIKKKWCYTVLTVIAFKNIK